MRSFSGFPSWGWVLLALLVVLTLNRCASAQPYPPRPDPLSVPWTANSAERVLDLIAPWEEWWVHDCTDDPSIGMAHVLGQVCMYVAASVVDLAEFISFLPLLPDLEGWLDWPDPWMWTDISAPPGAGARETFILRNEFTLSGQRFVVSVADMQTGKVSMLIILWTQP